MTAEQSVTLSYEDGTIRVDGHADALADLPGVETDPRSKSGRAPAVRYAELRSSLDERGLAYEDRVLSLAEGPDQDLASAYELRPYQREALSAWQEAGQRGVLELPTGSGKTVIAIEAIEALGTPTLVVVPTIDLVEQWRRELGREFDVPVGQLGGGKQRVEFLTVSTYDSAYLRADDLGDRFGFVVFDEVHHLGGEGYRDVGRLLAAPARMGLTATFERPDGAHEVVEDLIGGVVHRIDADELAGEHLADYDIKRIEVALTPEERERYEDYQGTFTDYLASTDIRMRSGSDYQELVMRSGNDPRAREALLAKQRAREVMMNAERKVERLADILERHRADRTIVFTAFTDLVYRLSERFLLPAITHETAVAERREILERFRRGEYTRIVSSHVLDEGIDVPAANVAVVLSGSGSEREFTQRLGRILRPSDDSGGLAGVEGQDGPGVEGQGGPGVEDGEWGRIKRALLYELVTEETAEERVARRRR